MYSYKANLQKLFSTEMTRREFLAHIGVALLIIIGVKGILDHLVNKTDSTQPDGVKGYSSGAYGR